MAKALDGNIFVKQMRRQMSSYDLVLVEESVTPTFLAQMTTLYVRRSSSDARTVEHVMAFFAQQGIKPHSLAPAVASAAVEQWLGEQASNGATTSYRDSVSRAAMEVFGVDLPPAAPAERDRPEHPINNPLSSEQERLLRMLSQGSVPQTTIDGWIKRCVARGIPVSSLQPDALRKMAAQAMAVELLDALPRARPAIFSRAWRRYKIGLVDCEPFFPARPDKIKSMIQEYLAERDEKSLEDILARLLAVPLSESEGRDLADAAANSTARRDQLMLMEILGCNWSHAGLRFLCETLLHSQDVKVASAALDIVRFRRQPCGSLLRAFVMGTEDEELAASAIRVLGDMYAEEDVSAETALAAILECPRAGYREAAAKALGACALKDPAANLLKRVLSGDQSESVRVSAAIALARHSSQHGIMEVLLKALERDESELVCMAIAKNIRVDTRSTPTGKHEQDMILRRLQGLSLEHRSEAIRLLLSQRVQKAQEDQISWEDAIVSRKLDLLQLRLEKLRQDIAEKKVPEGERPSYKQAAKRFRARLDGYARQLREDERIPALRRLLEAIEGALD
ncbi:MAG: hypothetical protein ACYTKD_26535 [Planctomycetota bacterium]|jgi:hypothetical protein